MSDLDYLFVHHIIYTGYFILVKNHMALHESTVNITFAILHSLTASDHWLLVTYWWSMAENGESLQHSDQKQNVITVIQSSQMRPFI